MHVRTGCLALQLIRLHDCWQAHAVFCACWSCPACHIIWGITCKMGLQGIRPGGNPRRPPRGALRGIHNAAVRFYPASVPHGSTRNGHIGARILGLAAVDPGHPYTVQFLWMYSSQVPRLTVVATCQSQVCRTRSSCDEAMIDLGTTGSRSMVGRAVPFIRLPFALTFHSAHCTESFGCPACGQAL